MDEVTPGIYELVTTNFHGGVLLRYRIGDLVLAFRAPYFRCIGRDRWWTVLNYAWSEFQTLNLGQL